MSSNITFARKKWKPDNATTHVNGVAEMNLNLHKVNKNVFYYTELNTATRISAAVHPSTGKDSFSMTLRTFALEPGKTSDKNTLLYRSAFDYQIKAIQPYHAETAMHLGLNPAHLVTKPESVAEYLKGLNVDDTMLHMYEDLGMSPEDTAKAIRMQQKMAESGQDDAQASTDYLADMSGYEFTTSEGMSL